VKVYEIVFAGKYNPARQRRPRIARLGKSGSVAGGDDLYCPVYFPQYDSASMVSFSSSYGLSREMTTQSIDDAICPGSISEMASLKPSCPFSTIAYIPPRG
jgi:hypothetical protein